MLRPRPPTIPRPAIMRAQPPRNPDVLYLEKLKDKTIKKLIPLVHEIKRLGAENVPELVFQKNQLSDMVKVLDDESKVLQDFSYQGYGKKKKRYRGVNRTLILF